MPGKTKYNQQKHGSPSAQALVEMALLLPILLVLIISAIELGRLFYTKIVITNAAREGAYYFVTHASDDDNVTGNTVVAAETEANNSGVSDITVAITPQNCCEFGAYSIVITVETKVNNLLILGFLGNTLSITTTDYDEFPLSSSVEMMVQP